MGVDYDAVGGFGYQFDYDYIEEVFKAYYEKKKYEFSSVEETLECDDALAKIFELPKGFSFGEYGERSYTSTGGGVFFISDSNNIKANFKPLLNWFKEIGLVPDKDEPKIIIELLVW